MNRDQARSDAAKAIEQRGVVLGQIAAAFRQIDAAIEGANATLAIRSATHGRNLPGVTEAVDAKEAADVRALLTAQCELSVRFDKLTTCTNQVLEKLALYQASQKENSQ